MTLAKELHALSDDELLHRLADLLSRSRRIESELVAHIAEVDERKLYLRYESSMFAYCAEVLHLSEPEAYLRIAVARATRRFPVLLPMLGDGRLHLSGIALLTPHLTEENCESVVAQAVHKSKRRIEELVAALAPRPDVAPTIRKLPPPQLRPDGVEARAQREPTVPRTPPVPAVTPRPEPLSPERFKVQFTANRELRDKLERLQTLMRTDLTAVIEASVTEKLERLEAKRYAETKAPRKKLEHTDTAPKSRYIPAAVRRAVRKRDGDRCRFVSEDGKRCTERRGLEFHHHEPYGRGGDHRPDNVSLLCRQHNVYLAEKDYGKDRLDRYRGGDRVSEPYPCYGESSIDRASSSWRGIPIAPYPSIACSRSVLAFSRSPARLRDRSIQAYQRRISGCWMR